MRMGKKLTCLSAGLMVALSAGACGGDAEEAAENPASDPAIAPQTGATPAATDTTAMGGATTPSPTTPAAPGAAPAAGGDNAALAAQGQQAYATSVCVSCHGPNGQGTPLAPAFTDSEWLWVQPGPNMQAQVAAIIKQGVPQPKDPAHVAPMLPYGGVPLSDDQVNALAAYVVSLGG